MQNSRAEINQNLEAKEWKITCEMFAPYAPEENPIEAIWLSLKNLLRRGCLRRWRKRSKPVTELLSIFRTSLFYLARKIIKKIISHTSRERIFVNF